MHMCGARSAAEILAEEEAQIANRIAARAHAAQSARAAAAARATAVREPTTGRSRHSFECAHVFMFSYSKISGVHGYIAGLLISLAGSHDGRGHSAASEAASEIGRSAFRAGGAGCACRGGEVREARLIHTYGSV